MKKKERNVTKLATLFFGVFCILYVVIQLRTISVNIQQYCNDVSTFSILPRGEIGSCNYDQHIYYDYGVVAEYKSHYSFYHQ